jgi:hypothetical protein
MQFPFVLNREAVDSQKLGYLASGEASADAVDAHEICSGVVHVSDNLIVSDAYQFGLSQNRENCTKDQRGISRLKRLK